MRRQDLVQRHHTFPTPSSPPETMCSHPLLNFVSRTILKICNCAVLLFCSTSIAIQTRSVSSSDPNMSRSCVWPAKKSLFSRSRGADLRNHVQSARCNVMCQGGVMLLYVFVDDVTVRKLTTAIKVPSPYCVSL